MIKKIINNKGLTLIEVLIATAIFAITTTIAVSILLDVVHLEKKSSIQNVIYEDAQLIMQLISKEIQNGTIDYEEYFSIHVVQGGSDAFYGINYGAYASRFYDPGLSQKVGFDDLSNPTNLGVECSVPDVDTDLDICEIVYTLSGDRNTGQNPFYTDPYNPGLSNAFCDKGKGHCGDFLNKFNELYLIDSTGTRKTILATKEGLSTYDSILSIMRMKGHDFDQNGVIDTFVCEDEFNCIGDSEDEIGKLADILSYLPFINSQTDIANLGIRLPHQSYLSNSFTLSSGQFVPLSPLRSSIKDLIFVINPIEDPYRAYAESDVQVQPSVTIILTLDLSEASKEEYPGDFNPVTLQTNVAAGVVTNINSYPPTRKLDWLNSIGLNSVPY
ncbi:type II secretion system protein J [Patescibacteria group bacterium]